MKYSDEVFGRGLIHKDDKRVWDWVGSDTIDLFDSNLGIFTDNYSLNQYIKNPIKYVHNKNGFRTPDEFNSVDEGNIFLGCSHTEGVGHHLENVWSYRLNKHVGGKFWNLAVGASGVLTAHRLFMHYITKLKVKNVFMYIPHIYRYEFWYNGDWNQLSLVNIDKIDTSTTIKSILIDDYQAFTAVSLGVKSIAYECSKRGINFYFDNHIPQREHTIEHASELKILEARDLIHFCINDQNKIYDKFMNLFSSKKTFDQIEDKVNLIPKDLTRLI